MKNKTAQTYTLLNANGSYIPLSTHPTIASARKALRAYPKALAAYFRGSENATGKLSYTMHFAIAKGAIESGPCTSERYQAVDALVVERWIADRDSAEIE